MWLGVEGLLGVFGDVEEGGCGVVDVLCCDERAEREAGGAGEGWRGRGRGVCSHGVVGVGCAVDASSCQDAEV